MREFSIIMSRQVAALVVEANYLIASAIEAPLVQSGINVVVATNDKEARDALASHRLELAILDFRLQHAGADGLVSRLKAAGIPYAFCTAATTEEVVEQFPGARVIRKPFADEGLLSVVAELVGPLAEG